ncbi:MAG: hypothetical protein WBZ36_28480 [Candidatus Nitrosopolaris sp.]
MSFIFGFSVAQLLKKPVGWEIVSPIVSVSAVIGGYIGVFRQFFKDRREERKIPVLKIRHTNKEDHKNTN